MKIENSKIFVLVILLGLSLFTALLLEAKMTSGFVPELVLILIGIILTAGIVFGLWIEEPWAYPLAIVLFAASLINLLWLFSNTNTFLTFAFGLLVNVAGLVICMASMERIEMLDSLETYKIPRTTARTTSKTKKRKKKR